MYNLYNKTPKTRTMVYLASPYSVGRNGAYGPADTGTATEDTKHQRYIEACKAAGALMKQGYVVFCPIAHSHAIERDGMSENQTGDFWLDQDLEIVSRCDKVFVLMLPNWEQSRGIRREVDFANNNNIPVEYVTYESITRASDEAQTA